MRNLIGLNVIKKYSNILILLSKNRQNVVKLYISKIKILYLIYISGKNFVQRVIVTPKLSRYIY